MSGFDLDSTPADARDTLVHAVWRAWRDAAPTAPTIRPAVSSELLGDGPGLRQALQHWPAEAVRWCMLATHPSDPLPWNDNALQQALVELAHLYEARETAAEMEGIEPAPKVAHALGAPALALLEKSTALRRVVSGALADDFDTATALAQLADLARTINRFANHKQAQRRGAPIVQGALKAMSALTRPLGLLGDSIVQFRSTVARKRLPARGLSPGQVQALIDDRIAARLSRDWDTADAIRATLDEAGIVVIDGAAGSQWRVRP